VDAKKNVKPDNWVNRGRLFLLCFYVPEDYCEHVKEAIFKAGAGKLGHYDKCSWQSPGQGQFRPLEGSNPALGENMKLEHLVEYKVELICEESLLPDVLKALLDSHPYEEVAYHYVPINSRLSQ
jgi:structural hemagglutinin/hemolysin toxin protein RtxA